VARNHGKPVEASKSSSPERFGVANTGFGSYWLDTKWNNSPCSCLAGSDAGSEIEQMPGRNVV
jgi:hypothetical protein